MTAPRTTRPAAVALAALCAAVAGSRAPAGEVFVSGGANIWRLIDRTGDGDYLDAAEIVLFANISAATYNALSASTDALFALNRANSTIYLLCDLNGDGDALDAGDTAPYLALSASPATQFTADSDGTLWIADAPTGRLLRARDLDGDGDVADFAEVLPVADLLANVTALALRPDGRILLATSSNAIPVRILEDRNLDGDFYDFAENLSYQQSGAAAAALVAADSWNAFLLRSATAAIDRLHDRTRDHDVLDAGEVLPFASGLPASTAMALLSADPPRLLVLQTAAAELRLVADLNGDGDALDAAEVRLVATLPSPAQAVTVAPSSNPPLPCLPADLDGDGQRTPADVALFVPALLDMAPLDDLCPADLNADGLLNAADIQPFLAAYLAPPEQ